MNKIKIYTSFLIFFLYAGLSSAQEQFRPMDDIAGFRSSLEGMSKATQTIVSEFVQEKNLVVLSEKIISKGIFYFRRENNIRWEYTQPYRYLIIISKGQLFTRDDRNQKLYDIESNKMFQEMNRFITGCIQGDILRDDKDYSTGYFESSSHYFVKLVPKSEKMRQMLNEIQILFDKKDLTVSGLKMIESGQDYTKIDFINKKLNTDIPIEKFSFK